MIIGIEARSLEGERTGVGRYLFNLIKLWSAGQPAAKFILYFKNEIPEDLPQSEFFESRLLKVKSTAKFIHWNLPRAAEKDKVDILFCPAYVAPLSFKGKIALTLHDIIYEAHPEWFNWPSVADRLLLKFVSKKAAQKAAAIFTCSEFSRREIIRHYGVATGKIAVVPLSADPDLSGSQSDFTEENLRAVQRKYGLGDNFIFYVGSIFSRRHLPEIIAAFKQLAAQAGGWQLLIGGRDYTAGRSVDKLTQKINAALDRLAIVRVDFINDYDLKLLYRACAFFIWLSDYEGFGLPPLEAMAGGAPVVTSAGSSLTEVAGQAALLVKDNSDIEEIYQAMKKVLENDALRAEMIEKGKQQAAKFSWEKCAEKTLDELLKKV